MRKHTYKLIDSNELCERINNLWDCADEEKKTLVVQVLADIVTPCIVWCSEIGAIPIAVLQRKLDGIDAADACDQATRWDYAKRNAIKEILDWYTTPDYDVCVEHTNIKRRVKL